MTPVEFHFVTPNGLPVANTTIEIQLVRSGYNPTQDGVLMPRLVEAVTDAEGQVTVELLPLDFLYYVTVYDAVSEASLNYKFYVPEMEIPGTPVRLQDIVVDAEMSGTTYDEAALLLIHAAKSNAMAAQVAAQVAATAAQASADSAGSSVAGIAALAASSLASKNTAAAAATAATEAAAAAQAAIINLTPSMFDLVTFAEYRAAINGAASGSKRTAGASALIAAFNPTHRLRIFRNADIIIEALYTGPCVASVNGSDIGLTLGTLASATVLTGDLDTGVWTFELQGGTDYTRKLSGTVGKAGSWKNLILDGDTAAGDGFDPSVVFVLPSSIS